MRWIRQRNSFGCVPVAFLNILKWKGEKVSYRKDYTKWCRLCKTTMEDGSWDWTDHIKSLGLKVKKRVYPTVKEITAAVKQGGIALIKSAWDDGYETYAHVFLVTEVGRKGLFCVNIYGGHWWVSRFLFKEWYMKKYRDCLSTGYSPAPFAYFLNRP